MTVLKSPTLPSQTVWSPPSVRTSLSSSTFVGVALSHQRALTHSHTSLIRYKAYRDEQAKLHAAWRTREDARLAAIARGDPNPPRAEADPTAQQEIGLLGLLKFFAYLLVGILLMGKFITGEWGWGFDGAANVRKWWPTQQRLFSESGLARFDGTAEGLPIYLAVRRGPSICWVVGGLMDGGRLCRLTGTFMMSRVTAVSMALEGPTRSCTWPTSPFSQLLPRLPSPRTVELQETFFFFR